MSSEAAGARLSLSPPASGRNSPVPRTTRRTVESDLLKADKNLRRYATNIERALSTWEISPEEWADYIAFLSRLLKAVQTHPKDVTLFPHSGTVAMRLAQCLNPALPSGVHQKALEVYAYLFSAFGNDYLAEHLHEFLPGLVPVLSFASLSVRPMVYELFQEHVVHLPLPSLRPALKAIILGFLPALEEDHGEDFERAFGVLHALELSFGPNPEDAATKANGDGYFWQCLFLAIITSPPRRLGALNYLVRQMPKFGSKPDLARSSATSMVAESIISPEPGLLIRTFVCGLLDIQILTQRGFLELLVTNLPLHSAVLQQKVGEADLDRLVEAAARVILRKDMGLNRRLWSWFLGPDPKDSSDDNQASSPDLARKASVDSAGNHQLQYFSSFGKASLERCILKMLHIVGVSPSTMARPYRVCTALMDRWEIGGLLIPQVFLPGMQSLHAYALSANSADSAEVLRSAREFFDGVEASLIWECLLGVLWEALDRKRTVQRNLQLFLWIINEFNIRDEEMLNIHIPQAVLYLASHLNSQNLSMDTRVQIVAATSRLLTLLPARMFLLEATDKRRSDALSTDSAIQKAVLSSYRGTDRSGDQTPSYPVQMISNIICLRATSTLRTAIATHDAELYQGAVAVILGLLAKRNNDDILGGADLRGVLLDAFSTETKTPTTVPFPILIATISLLSGLDSTEVGNHISGADIAEIEPALTSQLWHYMSPSLPKYHVEAVKALWQLDELVDSDDALIATLTSLVREVPSSAHSRADAVRRLIVLWTHSISSVSSKPGLERRASSMSFSADPKQTARSLEVLEQPLMIMLDILSDSKDPAFDVVKSWLQQVSTLNEVFQLLLKRLTVALPIREDTTLATTTRGERRVNGERLEEVIYVLSHFQNILANGNHWIWRCFCQTATFASSQHAELNAFMLLGDICARRLCSEQSQSQRLNHQLLSVLNLLLTGPSAMQLKPLELDSILLDRLMVCIDSDMHALQGEILKLIHLALKLKLVDDDASKPPSPGLLAPANAKRPSTATFSRPAISSSSISPPPHLFQCLRLGFGNMQTRYHLNEWLAFLAGVLPTFADVIFSELLPLVEVFCTELSKAQQELVTLSLKDASPQAIAPESTIIGLLEGLEMVLDRAYESLLNETAAESTVKEPETRPTFFSTTMFKSDGPPSRNATVNSRLTVILTFQDSIRVATKMWLWASNPTHVEKYDQASTGTTAYNALKVRNRSRSVLEQIFSLEPLESLEVIMSLWSAATTSAEAISIIRLLHVMQVSKPKSVVPAILDALCSRTNPSAIPAARHSSLTVDLKPSEIATFLSAYLESTEDDAIDEVWPDCTTFLRDVLANPLPQHQVLSHLLSIILLLAEKLNNTNFGEQRKMRRDLGDIFQRLLSATFTTLPSSYIAESKGDLPQNGGHVLRHGDAHQSMALLPVLSRVTAKLDLVLESSERMATAINNISQNLISPMFRAKSFPENVTEDLLELVVNMSRKAPGAKTWKKEVADAFNDPKILQSTPQLVVSGWFQVLHQWSLHDNERMPELLSRLAPPSSAGIMFGVGASAARLEADRKTQLNIRRICLLLLASPEDTYAAHIRTVEEKLAELFEASLASSPSATIKAELFMLCRTLALSFGAVHLAPLWPIMNDKLQAALLSLLPNSQHGNGFNNLALLQACKLLELLILISPDEFQLHEWLYISDTIDAVYQPADWTSAALSDQIAADMSSSAGASNVEDSTSPGAMDKRDVKAMPREEFASLVVREYLTQLSIRAYEGVYGMEVPDVKAMKMDVLKELLDINSIVE